MGRRCGRLRGVSVVRVLFDVRSGPVGVFCRHWRVDSERRMQALWGVLKMLLLLLVGIRCPLF